MNGLVHSAIGLKAPLSSEGPTRIRERSLEFSQIAMPSSPSPNQGKPNFLRREVLCPGDMGVIRSRLVPQQEFVCIGGGRSDLR